MLSFFAKGLIKVSLYFAVGYSIGLMLTYVILALFTAIGG